MSAGGVGENEPIRDASAGTTSLASRASYIAMAAFVGAWSMFWASSLNIVHLPLWVPVSLLAIAVASLPWTLPDGTSS